MFYLLAVSAIVLLVGVLLLHRKHVELEKWRHIEEEWKPAIHALRNTNEYEGKS